MLATKMEATMYDSPMQKAVGGVSKPLKRPGSLDFIQNQAKPKAMKLTTGNLLDSPALDMLKLASPELERMIIAHNGMVTTTPTPTKFLCPSNVTESQEQYARGFVDALDQLHKTDTSPGLPAVVTSSPDYLPSTSSGQYTTLTSLPGGSLQDTIVTQNPPLQVLVGQSSSALPLTVAPSSLPNMGISASSSITHSRVCSLKEEPQTVPCVRMTPPVSPINMEEQERVKEDRKRARNRLAAQKCRTRKLERIARLEEKVEELKGHNTDLSTTARDLRAQVAKLKEQILQHVQSGCQVLLNQNLV